MDKKLISKSAIREKTEYAVSEEFEKEIEKKVEEIIKEAERRARANNRRSLLARDL